jgi:hypothetical protein
MEQNKKEEKLEKLNHNSNEDISPTLNIELNTEKNINVVMTNLRQISVRLGNRTKPGDNIVSILYRIESTLNNINSNFKPEKEVFPAITTVSFPVVKKGTSWADVTDDEPDFEEALSRNTRNQIKKISSEIKRLSNIIDSNIKSNLIKFDFGSHTNIWTIRDDDESDEIVRFKLKPIRDILINSYYNKKDGTIGFPYKNKVKWYPISYQERVIRYTSSQNFYFLSYRFVNLTEHIDETRIQYARDPFDY